MECLGSYQMGVESFSAGHSEYSVCLSSSCGVGLAVSELPFWLKPGAQFSPVGQNDAKTDQTERLTEAEREGLKSQHCIGKSMQSTTNSR